MSQQFCAKAMNSINKIELIRNSSSKEVCQTIVQALVISHLDYANAILIDLPDITMKKITESTKYCCKAGFRK